MSLAPFTGNLRDFMGDQIDGARMWVHPLAPSNSGQTLLADRPSEVSLDSTGSFSVDLEEHARYRLEVVFSDAERSRLGMAILGEFRMPVGGGNAGTVVGLPVSNGMVRVLQSTPNTLTLDQYSYNELTGDLYERTS